MMGLTPIQLGIVRAILERHVPGRAVMVYGSRARGNFRRFSDLDLAIMGDPVPFGLLGDIKDAFVESDLPFKVDVTPWASLSESFRERIKPDLVPLPDVN